MAENKLAKIDLNNLSAELQKIKTTADFFGPEGLMKRMIKTALEVVLEAELQDHLVPFLFNFEGLVPELA